MFKSMYKVCTSEQTHIYTHIRILRTKGENSFVLRQTACCVVRKALSSWMCFVKVEKPRNSIACLCLFVCMYVFFLYRRISFLCLTEKRVILRTLRTPIPTLIGSKSRVEFALKKFFVSCCSSYEHISIAFVV